MTSRTRLLLSHGFETWGTWPDVNQSQRGLTQRLVGNTAALSLAQLVRVGFNTVLSLLIARQLGAAGFGKYGVLTAYINVFQVLAMAGVPRLVIRGMARAPEEEREWFRRTVASQVLTAACSTGILILLVHILSHPPDTTRALIIAAMSLVPFGLSSATEVAFRAREKMGLITVTQTASMVTQAIGSVWVLLMGGGIVGLAWMVVLGQVVAAIVGVRIADRMRLWNAFRIDLKGAMYLVRHAKDFFLVSSSVVVFSRLDVLILAQMVGEEAVGVYNAAYLIIRVVNFLSVSYSDAAYPVFSRLYDGARGRFKSLLHQSLLFGTAATLLIAILLAVVAEPVIGLLYQGQEYLISARLLRIEAPFTVVFVWNALLSSGLMAADLQHRSVVVSGAKLGLGLVYYLVLTAWLGVTGTAIATVVAGTTGTALNYFFLSRELHSLDLMTLAAKPLMAGAILVATLWAAQSLPWPGLVVGGTVFYVLLLLALRILSVEDIRHLREAIRL